MAKSAVVFVANGCEPVEVVAPVDALRRGGVDVVLAAVSDDLTVRAAQAVTLQADAPLSTLDLTQFDIAIVPGGSVGVDNLGKSQRVVAELTRRMEAGEYVAAICAGPMVLANAGLLTGRDIINQLKGQDLKGRLLLPPGVLRSEGDLFLDDTHIDDLQKAVGVPAGCVPGDGYELCDYILSL